MRQVSITLWTAALLLGALSHGGCFYYPEVPDCVDHDGDGYGAAGFWNEGCPFIYEDCDDTNATIHPDAEELCDDLDNDCNGFLGLIEIDNDNDGFSECQGDCDDDDPTRHPDAEDICDGIDNNCDGQLSPEENDDDGDGVSECHGDCDDGDAAVNPNDDDGDGVSTCDEPPDCEDSDSSISPLHPELPCDGLDNDCDAGTPDDPDNDGDGASVCDDCNDGVAELNLDDLDGDGYSTCEGDCDDGDDALHPGMDEVGNDGIDQDCDGVDLGGCNVLSLDGTGDALGLWEPFASMPNNITVELWLRPATDLVQGGDSSILLSLHDSVTAAEGWSLGYDGGAGARVFEVHRTDGSTLTASGAASLPAGGWHHVAAVAGLGEAHVFLDGVAVASDTGAGVLLQWRDYLTVGGLPAPVDAQYLEAMVDEIRISQVGRYSAQIPFTPGTYLQTDANTLALLHLDQGTGNPADDGPNAVWVDVSGNPAWITDCLGAP